MTKLDVGSRFLSLRQVPGREDHRRVSGERSPPPNTAARNLKLHQTTSWDSAPDALWTASEHSAPLPSTCSTKVPTGWSLPNTFPSTSAGPASSGHGVASAPPPDPEAEGRRRRVRGGGASCACRRIRRRLLAPSRRGCRSRVPTPWLRAETFGIS